MSNSENKCVFWCVTQTRPKVINKNDDFGANVDEVFGTDWLYMTVVPDVRGSEALGFRTCFGPTDAFKQNNISLHTFSPSATPLSSTSHPTNFGMQYLLKADRFLD